ncbi:MAG: hypothetical protein PF485_03270 [Bacteroidales bacterium]|nr:hypothetical protein [Bacteroidales bacterium]
MKNLIICLILILLFGTTNATDLDLYKTYLPEVLGQTSPRFRGPPGTTMYLELNNGTDSLYHKAVFDGNGLIYIYDIFNPDTGIETTVIPSNENFMEVYGNNLLFSAAYDGTKGERTKVLSAKVFNFMGQLLDNLKINDHGDYVTAHWDGSKFSSGAYGVVVETEKGITARKTTFFKDANSRHIPDFLFDKLNEHNAKQNLENIVEEKPVNTKALSEATFTYICDTTGVNQHETTVFHEIIDTSSAYFEPTHYLTPLRQQLDADFKIINGLTGEYITDASAQILNGEHEVIGPVTPINGEFHLENLPTDSTFYIQVSHPTLRNMEYNLVVPIRTTLNDSICEQPYFGIIPGDASHKIALFPEAGDYVGMSNGVAINNPDFTWMRCLEGQVESGLENHDGRVVNWNKIIPMFELTSAQKEYLDNYAKTIHGVSGFNALYSESASSIPATNGSYEDGMYGINWGDTGNTTEAWTNHMYDNNGEHYAYVMSGGNTESGGELSTWHEMMNYSYPESVFSEESPANSSSGNYTINDPLAVQLKREVDDAKYFYGWFTGEASDLRKDVSDFK